MSQVIERRVCSKRAFSCRVPALQLDGPLSKNASKGGVLPFVSIPSPTLLAAVSISDTELAKAKLRGIHLDRNTIQFWDANSHADQCGECDQSLARLAIEPEIRKPFQETCAQRNCNPCHIGCYSCTWQFRYGHRHRSSRPSSTLVLSTWPEWVLRIVAPSRHAETNNQGKRQQCPAEPVCLAERQRATSLSRNRDTLEVHGQGLSDSDSACDGSQCECLRQGVSTLVSSNGVHLGQPPTLIRFVSGRSCKGEPSLRLAA